MRQSDGRATQRGNRGAARVRPGTRPSPFPDGRRQPAKINKVDRGNSVDEPRPGSLPRRWHGALGGTFPGRATTWVAVTLADRTATVERTTLAAPVKTGDGDITEAVSKLTWTATGPDAAIKAGQFQEFEVSAGPLPAVDQIVFQALQT